MRIELDNSIVLEEQTYSNRSYGYTETKIEGYVEDIEALKVSMYKMMGTEQYEYPIYTFKYGLRLKDLIGQDRVYVKAELKRRIEECLLTDDRISEVSNFKFTFKGDNCLCEFDVVSIFGLLSAELEAVV